MIYTDRFFWQVAPVLILPFGSFLAMRSLWLGPWLEHVVGLSPFESSRYLLVVSLAMIPGLAGGGLFAKLAADLRLPLATFVVFGVVVYIAVEVLIVLGVASQGYGVWLAYGFLAQIAVVVYALIAQHFGAAWSGRAVTAVNIFVFLFAFLAQSAFGLVLHLWPDSTGTGQPVDAYKAAFTAIIFLDALSVMWFVFMARRLRPKPVN